MSGDRKECTHGVAAHRSPTSDDQLRDGALPVGHDRCERVTLRVPPQTIDALEDLVDADEFDSVSSAFRAGAYEIVEEHDEVLDP